MCKRLVKLAGIRKKLDKELGIAESELINYIKTSDGSLKLYYPEPFIASPTYIHEDIFFIHIAQYMY